MNVSYAEYHLAVRSSASGRETALSLPGPLTAFLTTLKTELSDVAKEIGVNFKDLMAALATRSAYQIFKSIKFNLVGLLKGFRSLASLLPKGLHALFRELGDSKLITRLKSSASAVDEFLGRHPVIRKLSGPVMAALLLWMWTNASFIGDPWTDLDLGAIGQAFAGDYTFRDLFLSPAGLTGLTLFVAGLTTGLSIPWLGETALNVVLAVCFTIARKTMPALSNKLRHLMPKRAN